MHHPYCHVRATQYTIVHTQRFFGSSDSFFCLRRPGSLQPPCQPPHPHTNRTTLTHHCPLTLPIGAIFWQLRRWLRAGAAWDWRSVGGGTQRKRPHTPDAPRLERESATGTWFASGRGIVPRFQTLQPNQWRRGAARTAVCPRADGQIATAQEGECAPSCVCVVFFCHTSANDFRCSHNILTCTDICRSIMSFPSATSIKCELLLLVVAQP